MGLKVKSVKKKKQKKKKSHFPTHRLETTNFIIVKKGMVKISRR